jgi:hypothetical protein
MKFCQYSIAALMLILSGTAFTMERENSDVDEIVALVTFALIARASKKMRLMR